MRVDDQYKYSNITELIIGASMSVHNYLGAGFPEIVYKRALCIELRKLGLNFDTEVSKTIFYDGEFVGKRRLDLIVEEKVLVELKAKSMVDDRFYSQILNYLNVFGIEVGLFINFGAKSLFFRRFAHSIKIKQ